MIHNDDLQLLGVVTIEGDRIMEDGDEHRRVYKSHKKDKSACLIQRAI